MSNYMQLPFKLLATQLTAAIFADLPGLRAHMGMAPAINRGLIENKGTGKGAVPSSVLILLFPDKKGETNTVLIQRPFYDGVHSGQIAFPGGRKDPEDLNLQDTAIREANEEVGIQKDHVRILGRLSDLYIPPSNYLVSPFVGLVDHYPVFVADQKEVAGIIVLPLIGFLKAGNLHYCPITMADGNCLTTPCYKINGHTVWGATAMIMAELVTLVKKV